MPTVSWCKRRFISHGKIDYSWSELLEIQSQLVAGTLWPHDYADLWRRVLPVPSCLLCWVKQLNTGSGVTISKLEEETQLSHGRALSTDSNRRCCTCSRTGRVVSISHSFSPVTLRVSRGGGYAKVGGPWQGWASPGELVLPRDSQVTLRYLLCWVL